MMSGVAAGASTAHRRRADDTALSLDALERGDDGSDADRSDGDGEGEEALLTSPPPASTYRCHGEARGRLWVFLENPSSSVAARAFAAAITALVVLSAAVFCLETLPRYHRRQLPFWVSLEYFAMLAFTIEYLARLGSAPEVRAYAKSTSAVIDLLSFLPFYIELLMRTDHDSFSLSVARMLRLLRLLRLFKISRYSRGMKLFGRALRMSTTALQLMGLFLSLSTVLFATAMYFLERGEWDAERRDYYRSSGERSPFNSIPASFWWSIVTLCTVGYGDDVPVTVGGKVVAAAAMVCGIVIVALPLTIIGLNFSQIYNRSEWRHRHGVYGAHGPDGGRRRHRRGSSFVGGALLPSGGGDELAAAVHAEMGRKVAEWAAALARAQAAQAAQAAHAQTHGREQGQAPEAEAPEEEERAAAAAAAAAAPVLEMASVDSDGDDDPAAPAAAAAAAAAKKKAKKKKRRTP